MAYLQARMDGLDTQLQQSQARLSDAEAVVRRIGTADRSLDEVLDAISVQNALARETRREQLRIGEQVQAHARFGESINDLWQANSRFADDLARLERRLEFIRRETMLEVRYSNQAPGEVAVAEPKILNPEKLLDRPVRLNLGCGHLIVDDYLNVDGRDLPGIDIVADVGNLPVEPGTIDEIRSSHLLEHFPPPRLDQLLRYWYALLRPGGLFQAVVPDAESMIRGFVDGDTPWDDLKEVTFGGQEYSGDFHFTMFSQGDLAKALDEAGFENVRFVEVARKNGACLEMEIAAVKPERA
jgi:SAM-dependent methyltransferase